MAQKTACAKPMGISLALFVLPSLKNFSLTLFLKLCLTFDIAGKRSNSLGDRVSRISNVES